MSGAATTYLVRRIVDGLREFVQRTQRGTIVATDWTASYIAAHRFTYHRALAVAQRNGGEVISSDAAPTCVHNIPITDTCERCEDDMPF